MQTSAAGNKSLLHRRGFTLLELLVVISLVGLATASVVVSLRDDRETRLEQEAVRLASLLDSARAQSRLQGLAVRWLPRSQGFEFKGLPAQALPSTWLYPQTQPVSMDPLVLGPEPIIGAQAVRLTSPELPGFSITIQTDGLRPFAVQRTPS
jgi:general secretion pathway protein H